MGEKIPVTVLAGLPGSGKTTLLNQLLGVSGPDAADTGRIALVVSEIGEAALKHPFAKHISDRLVLGESGCLCCNVRGELVDALRDLFMAALRKQIPTFSRVLVETARDPASIMYTLRYEFFLNERYRYDGCIAVVDSVGGARQLAQSADAVQQLALADALVLGKADIADPGSQSALLRRLDEINITAPRYAGRHSSVAGRLPTLKTLPALKDLLQVCSAHLAISGDVSPTSHGPSLWSGQRDTLKH